MTWDLSEGLELRSSTFVHPPRSDGLELLEGQMWGYDLRREIVGTLGHASVGAVTTEPNRPGFQLHEEGTRE